MNAAAKESELPAPDSCAIMEGEDAEDDLLFATKRSLFGKIKSLTSKVRAGGVGEEHKPGEAAGWFVAAPCLSFPRRGSGGALTPRSPQRTSDGFDSVPLKTSSGSTAMEL